MAYRPRSLDELGQLARGAFRRYLPGTDAALQQTFVGVTAKVLALLSREFELRFAWAYKQLFVSTADEIGILRMHGADYRIHQKAPAAATGVALGAGTAGAVYPALVRFYSAGATFVSTAPATAASDGSVTMSVRAEGQGASTNRAPGASLILADPSLFPGLSAEFTVGPDGLGGGADIEGVEALRARILDRKARPPQGGSLSDYERFALEVPGVVRAWAFSFTGGIGSIAVHFLFEGRPDLIPTPADVAAVQAHIDSKRLIRVDDAVAVAPIPLAVAISIEGLSPDTPAIRAAIEAALRAMLLDRARPGLDADPFVLSRSWIAEAISTATGEDRHRLVQPSADLTFTGGRLPVLGAVNYA